MGVTIQDSHLVLGYIFWRRWIYLNQHVICLIRKIFRKRAWGHTCVRLHETPDHRGKGVGAQGLTVGTQQALKLGKQPDGVELPQEAVVVQAVPQLDDEATDESSQLWGQTPPHPVVVALVPAPLLPHSNGGSAGRICCGAWGREAPSSGTPGRVCHVPGSLLCCSQR